MVANFIWDLLEINICYKFQYVGGGGKVNIIFPSVYSMTRMGWAHISSAHFILCNDPSSNPLEKNKEHHYTPLNFSTISNLSPFLPILTCFLSVSMNTGVSQNPGSFKTTLPLVGALTNFFSLLDGLTDWWLVALNLYKYSSLFHSKITLTWFPRPTFNYYATLSFPRKWIW